VTTDEISKAIDAGKFVIGYKESMKALNTGKASRIIYANNIAQTTKKEIIAHAEAAKVPTEMFNGSNTELGVKCKRAHGVLVVALTKHESK
jgi:large subunit ribosomal protein L30e